jgi:hypothetical protein
MAGWRLYLFDCGDHSRLLIGKIPDEGGDFRFLMSQVLKRGEYDMIIHEFSQLLEETWTRKVMVLLNCTNHPFTLPRRTGS